MSRVDLSRHTGIPVSTINNWYGADRYPRVDYAVRIAASLETPIDILMGRPISPEELRLRDLISHLDETDTAIVSDIIAVLIEHRAQQNDA